MVERAAGNQYAMCDVQHGPRLLRISTDLARKNATAEEVVATWEEFMSMGAQEQRGLKHWLKTVRPSANASVIKEAADHLESRLAPFEAAASSVAETVPLSPPADGFDDGRLAALEVLSEQLTWLDGECTEFSTKVPALSARRRGRRSSVCVNEHAHCYANTLSPALCGRHSSYVAVRLAKRARCPLTTDWQRASSVASHNAPACASKSRGM